MMPVVDGGLLPTAPEEAVAFGSASGVPLLIGTTRDESAFFTVGKPGPQLAGRRRLATVDGSPDPGAGAARRADRLGAGGAIRSG